MCGCVSRLCNAVVCCPCRTVDAVVNLTERAALATGRFLFNTTWNTVKFTFRTGVSILHFPFRANARESTSLAAWSAITGLTSYTLSDGAALNYRTHHPAIRGSLLALGMSSLPLFITVGRVAAFICRNGLNPKTHAALPARVWRDFLLLETISLGTMGVRLFLG